jgi:hypothetical protein
MTDDLRVTIKVEFDDREQAWQLAQFIKRVCFDTFYEHTEGHLPGAERERRAYLMIGGLVEIEAALEKSGIAPR